MEPLPKGRHLLTVGGHRRLQEEQAQLERQRGEVANNIRTAKAHGDLSKNFEYHEAKREQGFVESRLAQLRHLLPTVEVVPPSAVSTERVGFGAHVRLRQDGRDSEMEVLIVGPLEADPMEGRISYETPLGAALWGCAVGDTAEAQAPAGRMVYQVLSIRAYEE